MKEKHKIRIHKVNAFLDRPIAVIVVLILLFVYFVYANHSYQSQNRKLLESTNSNTVSTNRVVKGQTDILNAIKQLANDNKVDSNEKTNIIICMLQVPVAQRTTDLQEQCRKQVESNLITPKLGVLNSTTPNSGNSGALPAQNTHDSKSTNTTTNNTTTNNTTPPPAKDGISIDLPLIPKIHIGSPF